MTSTKATGEKLNNLIFGLRHFGVGTKVTRSIYKLPDTYWTITRVKPSTLSPHGKIYGRLTWNGKMKDKDEEITSRLKREWKLLEFPDYTKFKGKVEF